MQSRMHLACRKLTNDSQILTTDNSYRQLCSFEWNVKRTPLALPWLCTDSKSYLLYKVPYPFSSKYSIIANNKTVCLCLVRAALVWFLWEPWLLLKRGDIEKYWKVERILTDCCRRVAGNITCIRIRRIRLDPNHGGAETFEAFTPKLTLKNWVKFNTNTVQHYTRLPRRCCK